MTLQELAEYKYSDPEWVRKLKEQCWKINRDAANACRGFPTSRIDIVLGMGSLGKTYSWMKSRLIKCFEQPRAAFVLLTENAKQADAFNIHTLFNRIVSDLEKERPDVFEWLGGKEATSEEAGQAEGTFLGKVPGKQRISKTKPTKKDGLWLGARQIHWKERVLGHLIPCTEYRYEKGKNYHVTDVLFDEFIPEDPTFQNINNDRALTSLLQTILRDDEVRVSLRANPVRMNSPILTMFGFGTIAPGQTKTWKNQEGKVKAVCHYIGNDNPYIKAYQHYLTYHTEAGAVAEASGFQYRILGVPIKKSGQTYKPKSPVHSYLCDVIHGEHQHISIWIDGDNIWIGEPTECGIQIALTAKYAKGTIRKDGRVSEALWRALQNGRLSCLNALVFDKLDGILNGK